MAFTPSRSPTTRRSASFGNSPTTHWPSRSRWSGCSTMSNFQRQVNFIDVCAAFAAKQERNATAEDAEGRGDTKTETTTKKQRKWTTETQRRIKRIDEDVLQQVTTI